MQRDGGHRGAGELEMRWGSLLLGILERKLILLEPFLKLALFTGRS